MYITNLFFTTFMQWYIYTLTFIKHVSNLADFWKDFLSTIQFCRKHDSMVTKISQSFFHVLILKFPLNLSNIRILWLASS